MDKQQVLDYSFNEQGDMESKVMLDKLILARWDMFMQNGHFRYNTCTSAERVLEGSQKYLAMFLPFRSKLRRRPESMLSVKQEFDVEKFNFTKIDESKELVCQLVNKDRIVSTGDRITSTRDVLIINVSPMNRGHCLLVPQVEACLPQVLTEHAVILAVEVMNLSSSSTIKIAFNSLCAYASVNHLHWHLYYQCHHLPVQTLPLASVKNTPYHIFSDQAYPARGWIWLLRVKDMNKVCNVVMEVVILTNWLAEKDIAHNVLLTKGAGVDGGLGEDWIRIIVWPRKNVLGSQGLEAGEFIMASFELSGQVSVFEEQKYDNITEEEVVKAQEEATVNVFKELQLDAEQLF